MWKLERSSSRLPVVGAGVVVVVLVVVVAEAAAVAGVAAVEVVTAAAEVVVALESESVTSAAISDAAPAEMKPSDRLRWRLIKG